MSVQDPYDTNYMHELTFVNSYLMFYDNFFTNQLKVREHHKMPILFFAER